MNHAVQDITIDEIDFVVGYDWSPGQKAIIHLAPEDCSPEESPEVEITEVYLGDIDLTSVIKDSVIKRMETTILENKDEA